jgi:universal stress protein E
VSETHDFRRVVVGLRAGEEGLPLAAYHARCLAQCLGAQITLVSTLYDAQVAYALDGRDPAPALAAQSGLLAAEQERLDQLAGSLHDWGATVSGKVVWQQPVYEGLLREVERIGADMLVVGTHAATPIPHTRLADTEWQLMRLCPCPLLLVRDAHFDGYPRMLAAVDPMHRHAEAAGLDTRVLDVATRLAGAFDANLRVAHAYPPAEAFALASAVEIAPGVFYGAENVAALHRNAVEDLVAGYGLGRAELELRAGAPSEVISDVAAELKIKLLVMGALKRGTLAQAVLGSTAEVVAASVSCDILLVK